MAGLSFPDVNVWLAIVLFDHVHHNAAKTWWESNAFDAISFTRVTQISVLRLLTTPAVMNQKPLTMHSAWLVYDRLFEDDRVTLLVEPANIDTSFREHASGNHASPKVWADAWLLAMADLHNATVITFDQQMAAKSNRCLLLQ